MSKPWRFRPEDIVNPDKHELDWDDNAISNSMAWATIGLPLCDESEDARNRLWPTLANYFWTNCPCCFFLRGFSMGFLTAALCTIIIALIYAILRSNT